jgi:hypothetical protein
LRVFPDVAHPIAFEKQIEITKEDIADNQRHNFDVDKKIMELLVFLWHWLFEVAESKSKSEAAAVIIKKPTKSV